jgi:hypothetical protein
MQGLASNAGGEWFRTGATGIGPIAPRTPGLTWVRDLRVGDVMVDGSVRRERLRPLVLSRVAAFGREPRAVWEQAGRVMAI